MPEVSCHYFPACHGCNLWDIPYGQQKLNKLNHLRQILNLSHEALSLENFISVQPYGLRQRFDFTVETQDSQSSCQQVMGLYGENRKLIDLDQCLQLAPDLQKTFQEFREIPLQTKTRRLKKASVRLRVGPSGLKGCWLDLANIDIKDLLEDETYLEQLLQVGFEVEIGQKGKSLKRINGKLKLKEPENKYWFQTLHFALLGLVSDFTQPSWQSADALVQVVLGWIKKKSIRSVIEFGPGIGQFTLPLLNQNIFVQAYENNPKAVEVLVLNAKNHHLEKDLKIFEGDFQNKAVDASTASGSADLVLVNPPRSGLKNFVNTIIATEAQTCIYVSCFPESMKTDIEKLVAAGYKIVEVQIVDQFPQTHHYESCVLLEKV